MDWKEYLYVYDRHEALLHVQQLFEARQVRDSVHIVMYCSPSGPVIYNVLCCILVFETLCSFSKHFEKKTLFCTQKAGFKPATSDILYIAYALS